MTANLILCSGVSSCVGPAATYIVEVAREPVLNCPAGSPSGANMAVYVLTAAASPGMPNIRVSWCAMASPTGKSAPIISLTDEGKEPIVWVIVKDQLQGFRLDTATQDAVTQPT